MKNSPFQLRLHCFFGDSEILRIQNGKGNVMKNIDVKQIIRPVISGGTGKLVEVESSRENVFVKIVL